MTYPITTTLEELMKRGIDFDEYNRLVRTLQGLPYTKEDEAISSYLRHKHDEPVPLTLVLETNGFCMAFWSLCASNASDRDIRMLSISLARRVEHLDKTGTAKKLNDINERFANGQATIGELIETQEALVDARKASWSEWAAVAGSARAAAAWALATVDKAAWEAEAKAQEELFIQMCNGEAPWQDGQP